MTSDQRALREVAQEILDDFDNGAWRLAEIIEDNGAWRLAEIIDDRLRQVLAHGVEVREPPTIPRKAALEFAAEFRRRAGRNDISQVAPALACDLALLLEREAARRTPLSGEPNAPETGQAGGLTSTGDVRDTEPGNAGIEDALHQTRAASPASSARQPSARAVEAYCRALGLNDALTRDNPEAWWALRRRALAAAYAIDFPSVPDAQDAPSRALLENVLNQLQAEKQSPTLCKRIRSYLQRAPGEP